MAKIENKRWMEFGQAVMKSREALGWNQKMLAKEIESSLPSGRCSQSKISRIECGTIKIDKSTFQALQTILQLPYEYDFLVATSEVSDDFPVLIHQGPNLFAEGTGREFESLSGVFHGIFHSTDSQEERINRLILTNTLQDGKWKSTCQILDDNSLAIKEYVGSFFYNPHYQTSYFILIGKRWNEVVMMMAHTYVPAKSDAKTEILVAQVLTSSAGRKKERTVSHRLILTRQRLTDSQVKLVASQLLLNRDVVYIRPEKLAEIKKKYQEVFKSNPSSSLCSRIIKACETIETNKAYPLSLLYFEEASIYEAKLQLGGNRQERALITAILRSESEGVYYNKVSETVEEIIQDILSLDLTT